MNCSDLYSNTFLHSFVSTFRDFAGSGSFLVSSVWGFLVLGTRTLCKGEVMMIRWLGHWDTVGEPEIMPLLLCVLWLRSGLCLYIYIWLSVTLHA